MKKILFIVSLVVLLVVILAWSPWMTKEYAEERVKVSFADTWKNVMDGCGMTCDGCGVTGSHRVLFGYSVSYAYGCGLRPRGDPNQEGNAFVSFIGTVSGLLNP